MEIIGRNWTTFPVPFLPEIARSYILLCCWEIVYNVLTLQFGRLDRNVASCRSYPKSASSWLSSRIWLRCVMLFVMLLWLRCVMLIKSLFSHFQERIRRYIQTIVNRLMLVESRIKYIVFTLIT